MARRATPRRFIDACRYCGRQVRVLLLSLQHAAAGANLQCANFVLFLDAPGDTPAHGVATEEQACDAALASALGTLVISSSTIHP